MRCGRMRRCCRASGLQHRSVHCAAATDVRADIAAKRRSAREVTEASLDRIAARDEALGAFLHVDREGALAQADAVDAAVAAGEPLGALAGVPVAVKDNICTAGVPTTAGSQILRGYSPPYSATVVERLRAAGAVIVGKTNLDEFGMGSTNENSSYKPCRNAWSAEHVPGGSSGGSAAAVAAGLVPLALGSDTGGSVRLPAHFNGCVGVKPTYGRVPRHGLLAYASSLDCIGPLARSVRDAAALLTVIAGHDARDSTSLREPVGDLAHPAWLVDDDAIESRHLRGLRVGLITETLGEGVSPAVRDAVRATAAHLETLGATAAEVSLPSFAHGLPAYYVIASSEASSNLSRYDGVRFGVREEGAELRAMYGATRERGFGAEVKRRILMGTYALSAGYYDAFYKKAQQVRTLVKADFERALGDFDVLLSPVGTAPAYRLGEKTADPVAMYAGDLMTVNLNMAGLPAVAINAAFAEDDQGTRLPVGVQFIGQHLHEAPLLALAHVFERTWEAARTYPPDSS